VGAHHTVAPKTPNPLLFRSVAACNGRRGTATRPRGTERRPACARVADLVSCVSCGNVGGCAPSSHPLAGLFCSALVLHCRPLTCTHTHARARTLALTDETAGRNDGGDAHPSPPQVRTASACQCVRVRALVCGCDAFSLAETPAVGVIGTEHEPVIAASAAMFGVWELLQARARLPVSPQLCL
jgi:hypothetical protein